MNSDSVQEHIKIKLRRDDSSRWSSLNPILLQGEPGFEIDTRRLKIGDGVVRWNDLNYIGDISSDGPVSDAALLAHIQDLTPHIVYDDGPSLTLLYANAKV